MKFRDPSAWQHICEVIDTSADFDEDRYRLYINGLRIPTQDFTWTTKYSKNQATLRSKALKHTWGGRWDMSNDAANMTLADVRYLDGVTYGPAAFAGVAEDGSWQPKETKVPTPNNDAGSPTWSSYWESSSDAGSTGNIENPANLFNGEDNKHSNNAQSNTFVRWVPPSPIAYNTLEIKFGAINNGDRQVYVNKKCLNVTNSGGMIYSDTNGTLREIRCQDTGSTHGRIWYVKIDGVMLVDGQVDPTAYQNLNNNITWSNTVTGSTHNSYPGSKAFDAIIATQDGSNDVEDACIPLTDNTVTWKPPTTINGHIEVRICRQGTNAVFTQNGTDISSSIEAATSSSVATWYKLPTNSINSSQGITWSTGSSYSDSYRISAIKVDGVILKDIARNNSYHLKFEDETNLGKDSLYSNDWTAVNFQATSGTVTKSEADSKPILGTSDDFGATYSSGYETDSNSSSLVLAISGKTLADNRADIKGSGSNHSISNSSSTTSTSRSKFYGTAIQTDGGSQHFVVADSSDFEFGSGEFTIEFWINAEDVDGDGMASWLMKGTNDSNNAFDWRIYASGDGSNENLYANIKTSDGSKDLGPNTNNAPNDEWVHVALVRDNTDNKIYFYKNGVKIDEASIASGATIDDDYNDGLTWGYFNAISGGNHYGFNGWVNDIRIYKGHCKYPGGTTFKVIDEGEPWNLDLLNDTPTNSGTGTDVKGNFPTWNPLAIQASGHGGLRQGNLEIIADTAGSHKATLATWALPNSGKWYWETKAYRSGAANNGGGAIGVAEYMAITTSAQSGYRLGEASSDSWVVSISSFDARHANNADHSDYLNGGTVEADTKVIGVAVDMDNDKMWLSYNGTWGNAGGTGNPATGANPAFSGEFSGKVLFPAAAVSVDSGSGYLWANFGQRPFKHTIPTGFKPLCSQSLDDTFTGAEANNPKKFFDVLTYFGTGTTSQEILGLEFQPDLVWIKNKDIVATHNLFDAARGNTKRIFSDLNQAENTNTNIFDFKPTGIEVVEDGSSADTNDADYRHVAWCWDAGSAQAATGTWGDNNKNYWRWTNATAGISIVKWVADNTTGADGIKIPHGLGVAPKWYITKNLDDAANWDTATTAIDGSFDGLLLNSENSYWNDSNTQMTNNYIQNWGMDDDKNGIAYCFAEIEGFSKFGTYLGNGSSSGPFVWTGFLPKLVIMRRWSANGRWVMIDTERSVMKNGRNNEALWAEKNHAASLDSENNLDILSNGFVLKSDNGNVNASNGQYWFAAFAETPFKTSRAQ